MDFEFLSRSVEGLDAWLTGLFDGAPLLVVVGIAFLLGLRHASDPDHLVAVTSLVAADDGDTRGAARLGAWWGLGHAAMLVVIGIPLIAFKSELPSWLESDAERAIGVVIILVALRVFWKWLRGDLRAGGHGHDPAERQPSDSHCYLRRGEDSRHSHRQVRSPRQALAIGLLHGLAGTGAVVVLLVAAIPSQLEAGLALVVFAPMSMVSMAICTTAFGWLLTRRIVEPVYRRVLIPVMGLFAVMYGAWYVGLG
jgi:ABC-type nickel/cobalt efflux system permease component RcnA